MPLTAFIFANIILFSMSVSPIFMKKLSLLLTAYQIAFIVSFVTLIISAVVLIVQNNFLNTAKILIDGRVILLAILIGGLGFIDLFAYAIALQKGSDVGVLLGYVRVGGTILTAMLGYMIFSEKLVWTQVIGIVLSCIGLFLVVRKFD